MALFNVSPRFSPVKTESPGPGSCFASPASTRAVLDLTNTSISLGSIHRSPAATAQKVATCGHCYSAFLYNLRRSVNGLKARNRSLQTTAERTAELNESRYREVKQRKAPKILELQEAKPQFWRRQSFNTRSVLEGDRRGIQARLFTRAKSTEGRHQTEVRITG